MFEALIKSLVKKHLREYVDLRADTLDSIAVSIWKGNLSIENVKLRREGIEKLLGSGIEFKEGTAKRIDIRIPWSSLSSQPVVITFEEIEITAGVNLNEVGRQDISSIEKMIELKVQGKRKQINRIEGFFGASTTYVPQVEGETSGKDKGFVTKLSKKIVDNLQLEMKNIHVQVIADNGAKFGFGIGRVSLFSADKDWKKSFLVGKSKMRKLLRFEDMFLYFSPDIEAQKKESEKFLFDRLRRPKHYEVCFSEELVEICVLVNDKVSAKEKGKYVTKLSLSSLNFCFSKKQYNSSLEILDTVQKSRSRNVMLVNLLAGRKREKKLKVPRSRPVAGPLARKWWRFAIFSVIHEQRLRKENLKRLKWLESNKETYIELYKRQLYCTRDLLPPLTAEEEKQFQQLEDNDYFSVDEIFKFRKVAEAEIRAQLKDNLRQIDVKRRREADPAEETPAEGGIWSTLSNWWQGSSPTNTPKESEFLGLPNLSEEEKGKIYDTIGFNPSEIVEKSFESDDNKFLDLSIELSEIGVVALIEEKEIVFTKLTSIKLSGSTNKSYSIIECKLRTGAIIAESNGTVLLQTAENHVERDKINALSFNTRLCQSDEESFIELSLNRSLLVFLEAEEWLEIASFAESRPKRRNTDRRLSISSVSTATTENHFQEEGAENYTAYKKMIGNLSVDDILLNQDYEDNSMSSNLRVAVHLKAPKLLIPVVGETETENKLKGDAFVFSFGEFELEKSNGEQSVWTFSGRNIAIDAPSCAVETNASTKILDDLGFSVTATLEKENIEDTLATVLICSFQLTKINFFLSRRMAELLLITIASLQNEYKGSSLQHQLNSQQRIVDEGQFLLDSDAFDAVIFGKEKEVKETKIRFQLDLKTEGLSFAIADNKDDLNPTLFSIDLDKTSFSYANNLSGSVASWDFGAVSSSTLQSQLCSPPNEGSIFKGTFKSDKQGGYQVTAAIGNLKSNLVLEDIPQAVERLHESFVVLQESYSKLDLEFGSYSKPVRLISDRELCVISLQLNDLGVYPKIQELRKAAIVFNNDLDLLCSALADQYPDLSLTKADVANIAINDIEPPNNAPHDIQGKSNIEFNGFKFVINSKEESLLEGSLNDVTCSIAHPIHFGEANIVDCKLREVIIASKENNEIVEFKKSVENAPTLNVCSSQFSGLNSRITEISLPPVTIRYPKKFVEEAELIYSKISRLLMEIPSSTRTTKVKAPQIAGRDTPSYPWNFEFIYTPQGFEGKPIEVMTLQINESETYSFNSSSVQVSLKMGGEETLQISSVVEILALYHISPTTKETLFEISDLVFPAKNESKVKLSGHVGLVRVVVTPSLRNMLESLSMFAKNISSSPKDSTESANVTNNKKQQKDVAFSLGTLEFEWRDLNSEHPILLLMTEVSLHTDTLLSNLNLVVNNAQIKTETDECLLDAETKNEEPLINVSLLSRQNQISVEVMHTCIFRLSDEYLAWLFAVIDDVLVLKALFSPPSEVSDTLKTKTEDNGMEVLLMLQGAKLYLGGPKVEVSLPPVLDLQQISGKYKSDNTFVLDVGTLDIFKSLSSKAKLALFIDINTVTLDFKLLSSNGDGIVFQGSPRQMNKVQNLVLSVFDDTKIEYKVFKPSVEEYRYSLGLNVAPVVFELTSMEGNMANSGIDCSINLQSFNISYSFLFKPGNGEEGTELHNVSKCEIGFEYISISILNSRVGMSKPVKIFELQGIDKWTYEFSVFNNQSQKVVVDVPMERSFMVLELDSFQAAYFVYSCFASHKDIHSDEIQSSKQPLSCDYKLRVNDLDVVLAFNNLFFKVHTNIDANFEADATSIDKFTERLTLNVPFFRVQKGIYQRRHQLETPDISKQSLVFKTSCESILSKEMSPLQEGETRKLHVLVGEISGILAFQDISSLMNLKNSVTSIIEKYNDNATQIVQSSAETDNKFIIDVNIQLKKTSLEVAGFDSLLPEVKVSAPVGFLITFHEEKDKAIANFEVEDADIFVLNPMNTNLEPFVENVTVRSNYEGKALYSKGGTGNSDVGIVIANPVTVNVRDVYIRSLTKLQDHGNRLVHSIKDDIELAQHNGLSLILQNVTGFPIVFERFEKEEQMSDFLSEESGVKRFECGVNGSVNMPFDDFISAERKAEETLRYQGLRFRVRHEDGEFQSTELPVIKPGLYCVKLEVEGHFMSFTWELKSTNSTMVARLGSMVQVENESGMSVHVSVKIDDSVDQVSSLLPNETNRFLQVFESQENLKPLITFRIGQDLTSKWYSLPTKKSVKAGLILFKQSDFSLKCTMEFKDCGLIVVKIMAPIVLTSLMTEELNFSLRKNQDTALLEKSLHSGESCYLYNVNTVSQFQSEEDKAEFEIRFIVSKFGESLWLPFNNLNKDISFAVRDNKNRVHEFDFKQFKRSSAPDGIVIAPKFVVVNETGLPLSYFRSDPFSGGTRKKSDSFQLIKEAPVNSARSVRHIKTTENEIFMHSTKDLLFAVPGLTELSQEVDLSLINNSQVIKVAQMTKSNAKEQRVYREYVVNVENTLKFMEGLASSVNYVHIRPRMLVYNCLGNDLNTGNAIYIAQPGNETSPILVPPLSPDENSKFSTMDGKSMQWHKGQQNLVFSIDGINWSKPFPGDQPAVYSFSIKLEGGGFRIVRVELKRGTYEQTFELRFEILQDVSYDKWRNGQTKVQYLVRNRTRRKIGLFQMKGSSRRKGFSSYCQPFQTTPFGWINPLSTENEVEVAVEGHPGVLFNIERVGEEKEIPLRAKSITLTTPKTKKLVFLTSAVDTKLSLETNLEIGELVKLTTDNFQSQSISFELADHKQKKSRNLCYGDVVRLVALRECRTSFEAERICISVSEDEVSWARISIKNKNQLFVIQGGNKGTTVNPSMLSLRPYKMRSKLLFFDVETLTLVCGDQSPALNATLRILQGDRKNQPQRLRLALTIENGTRILTIEEAFANNAAAESVDDLFFEESMNEYRLSVPELNFSFLNNTPREVICIYTSFEFNYKEETSTRSFEMSLKGLRVDNQRRDPWTINLLRATPTLPEESSAAADVDDEVLHFTLVQNTVEKKFTYIQYCALALTELDISLDSGVTGAIQRVVSSISSALTSDNEESIEEEKETRLGSEACNKRLAFEYDNYMQLLKTGLDGSKRHHKVEEQNDFYFEVLEIFTVRLKLTYHMRASKQAEETESEDVTASIRNTRRKGRVIPTDPLTHLFRALSSGFQSIDEAPIVLQAVVLEHPTVTVDELLEELQAHYKGEAKRNIFAILGHVAMFGGARKVINTLGGAVHVFVNEPAQGLVKSPDDFRKGVGKGTSALVKGTAQSLALFTQNVTGAASKGLQYATFDKEYIANRSNRNKKVQGMRDGLRSGGESFLYGLKSGVTGLVEAPRQGAKKDGFGGFVTGIGKGLIGAVAKPVDGVFGFVSKTTEGAVAATKSTAQRLIEEDRLLRRREPRLFVFREQLLLKYDAEVSEIVSHCLQNVAKVVKRPGGTRFSQNFDEFFANDPDELVAYYWFPQQSYMLIFTSFHASLFAFTKESFEKWSKREHSRTKSLRTLEGQFLGRRSLANIDKRIERIQERLKVERIWSQEFQSTHAQEFIRDKIAGNQYTEEEIVSGRVKYLVSRYQY